jgi:hypothetical protein
MPKITALLTTVLAFALWTVPAGAAMSDKEKAELSCCRRRQGLARAGPADQQKEW